MSKVVIVIAMLLWVFGAAASYHLLTCDPADGFLCQTLMGNE